jgi:hypothetical protein
MDMRTPQGLGPVADHRSRAKLDELAKVLGCSTDTFFEKQHRTDMSATAQLLQAWLKIETENGREVVFACAREILKAQPR